MYLALIQYLKKLNPDDAKITIENGSCYVCGYVMGHVSVTGQYEVRDNLSQEHSTLSQELKDKFNIEKPSDDDETATPITIGPRLKTWTRPYLQT